MIYVGLGANLPSRHGAPEQTLEAAKAALEKEGLIVTASSQTWRSAPVPLSDDPWYCNAVVAVKTELSPQRILQTLQYIERSFGRQESIRNAPRVIDLDFLVFNNTVIQSTDLIVPHPRMHERGFVLVPLREINPGWRHPVTNQTIDELIENIPDDQVLLPVAKDPS